MKIIIQAILKLLAKMVLWRYRPEIIGITGSIGKSSAKEAIYTVLKSKFKVRTNIKNYNNEIGLPLTILGLESGGSSIVKWLLIFLRALKSLLITDQEYPKVLILEMGVDRPGDMRYLNSIVRPNIGIVTYIGQSHIEFFGSVDNIKKEKELLIRNLPSDGWAVLNYDNEKTQQIKMISKAKTMTYGLSEKADVRALEIALGIDELDGKVKGLSFKLGYQGSYVPVVLPNVLGLPAVYAALAGASAGIIHGMNLIEISQALKYFVPPKGRLNLIAGINNSLIIDDTYNSSPQSALLALEAAKDIKGYRTRWAVLGDMLELGDHTYEGHRLVGENLIKYNFSRLITVGSQSIVIADTARILGMENDRIFNFLDSFTASNFVKENIGENDLILVKGSQGMRMEVIVKDIMKEPQKAKELLVRQGSEWIL